MRELKEQIKSAGISRKELAKRISVSYSHLNYWLNDFGDMPDYIKERIDYILEEAKK